MTSEDSSRSHECQSQRSVENPRESSGTTEQSQSFTSNQGGTTANSSSSLNSNSDLNSNLNFNLNSNLQPVYNNLITSNHGSSSQNYNNQDYAAQIVSGISSLGIEVSPYLQQALVDQHGSSTSRKYSYSTVMEARECSDKQEADLDLGPIPQKNQGIATHVGRDSHHHEDLAGIGAQFDD